MSTKQNLTVSIDKDLKETLEKEADKSTLSLSKYIEILLKDRNPEKSLTNLFNLNKGDKQ